MNKFKVGQRVKIIRTGKIGKIAELDNEISKKTQCIEIWNYTKITH